MDEEFNRQFSPDISIKKEKDLPDLQLQQHLIKTENTDEMMIAKSGFWIRSCFINIHQGLNAQEISSCHHCKKESIKIKRENRFVDGTVIGDNLSIAGSFSVNKNSKNGTINVTSTSKEMKNGRQLDDNCSYGTEQRIIKCMFRKVSLTKSKKNSSKKKGSPIPRVSNKEIFKCSKSEIKFTEKKNLEFNTGKKPYNCAECDKNFFRKHHLTIHLRSHTGEKPYGCNECGKNFSRKFTLTCHVRTHSGERPYNCNECGKHFSQRQNLTSHLRIHTGEKPYNCKECSKNFSRKHHLIDHLRTHIGKKPCKGDECNKNFSNKTNLK